MKEIDGINFTFTKIGGSKLTKAFFTLTNFFKNSAKKDEDVSEALIDFMSDDKYDIVKNPLFSGIIAEGFGKLDTAGLDAILEEKGIQFEAFIFGEAVKHYMGKSFQKLGEAAKLSIEAKKDTPTEQT